jgi:hypothetical protein
MRELNNNKKEVKMDNINLSLIKYVREIQNSFKKECSAFESFYKANTFEIVKGLKKVLN